MRHDHSISYNGALMRVWQISGDPSGGPLKPGEIPRPAPGPGEVLVRVHAAGVTPTELVWYPSTHTKDGGPRSLAVPGHEFSGTIEAIGDGVGGLQVGQAVYGMNDWFAEGATAEFCLARPEAIALKPARLSHTEAASVPIGALTAWQGLFDKAKLLAGEHVLIHGGSGAVGVYAIQLARRHGARVTTTASARNADLLRGLGAERVIDYSSEAFDKVLSNVDVIFDGVGGDTLDRSWQVLSPTGRLVTIAADSEHTTDDRVKKAFFIVEPSHTELAQIGDLLDRGELQPFVDAEVPFSAAGDAYAGKVAKRSGRGKVVIAIGR